MGVGGNEKYKNCKTKMGYKREIIHCNFLIKKNVYSIQNQILPPKKYTKCIQSLSPYVRYIYKQKIS